MVKIKGGVNNSNNNNTNSISSNNSYVTREEDIQYWKVIKSINEGNYQEVKQAIDNGFDVNQPDPDYGFIPLKYAIKANHLPIVKLLVESGADIKKTVYSLSPLSYANSLNSREIFNYLMEKCTPAPCTFVSMRQTTNNQNNNESNNENESNTNNSNVNNSNNERNSNVNESNNESSTNNNTIIPRNNINSLNIGTCFDPIMANESANAKVFLKEDKNNILIILGKKVVCVNRKDIKKHTQMFYECKTDSGYPKNDNVIKNIKYGKLLPYNHLVSENELEKIQNINFSVFKLNPVRNLKAIVSVEVKNREGTWVSADHCQQGSGGTTYEIQGFTLEDGIKQIKNIQQSGGRKTVKRFKKPTAEDMFLDFVASGRADLIEDYLDNGGDPKVTNCKGETALHIAVAHKRNDILERLLPFFSEEELDTRDMYGLPPHITAIKHGNEQGAHIINEFSKLIKTKPYKFRNYEFNNNNNWNRPKNQIVYPNVTYNTINNNELKNTINMLKRATKQQRKTRTTKKNTITNFNNEDLNAYLDLIRQKNKPQNKSFVPIYNNKNTKVLTINNKKGKKRQTKKKNSYHITQFNK